MTQQAKQGASESKQPIDLTDAGRQIYTIGQVAKMCRVAPRTVSKWFDSGRLKGYRIPGSQDRRIPIEYLRQFCEKHDIKFYGDDDPANSPTFEDLLADANKQTDRDYDRSLESFTYTEAVERYRNDVVFKSLVDAMRIAVRHGIVSLADYKQGIALVESDRCLPTSRATP